MDFSFVILWHRDRYWTREADTDTDTSAMTADDDAFCDILSMDPTTLVNTELDEQ